MRSLCKEEKQGKSNQRPHPRESQSLLYSPKVRRSPSAMLSLFPQRRLLRLRRRARARSHQLPPPTKPDADRREQHPALPLRHSTLMSTGRSLRNSPPAQCVRQSRRNGEISEGQFAASAVDSLLQGRLAGGIDHLIRPACVARVQVLERKQ